MNSKLKICILTSITIFLLIVIHTLYQRNRLEKLASMIRVGDAVGVSRLISSNPKLVNAHIDARTRLTPLDLAASLGQVSICSNLISAGANVNAQDIAGETPLYYSFGDTQNLDVLKMLLRHGADVTLTNINGEQPLYWAVVSENTNAVVMLLQSGADPSLKDRFGKTPLDYAKELTIPVNENIVKILSRNEPTSQPRHNPRQQQ